METRYDAFTGIEVVSMTVPAMALKLTVPKLACSACVETVTKAILGLDSQARVQGDPKTKIVAVELSTAFVNVTDRPQALIHQALETVGYPVADSTQD
jgi:copper chaperone